MTSNYPESMPEAGWWLSQKPLCSSLDLALNPDITISNIPLLIICRGMDFGKDPRCKQTKTKKQLRIHSSTYWCTRSGVSSPIWSFEQSSYTQQSESKDWWDRGPTPLSISWNERMSTRRFSVWFAPRFPLWAYVCRDVGTNQPNRAALLPLSSLALSKWTWVKRQCIFN